MIEQDEKSQFVNEHRSNSFPVIFFSEKLFELNVFS